MKKIFIFIFFLFFSFSSFAQFENINCIIFVDGKLTRYISGFVEYNNEFNQKDTANFYCDIGMIRFKTTDFEKLRSLPDTATLPNTTNIVIHLNYKEWQKKNCIGKVYHYSTSIPWIVLFYDKNSPIIFSITNFNKKKGIFYFDWMVSNFQKGWSEGYNKKHQIFYEWPCRPRKR
jgi:hypothetical protein